MSGRQVALVAVMSAILTACGAGAEPTPSGPVGDAATQTTSSLDKVTPAPTISVASPSLATPKPTPEPTPMPTAKPTPGPTPKQTPPKPTGVTFDWESESICDSGPEGLCEVSGFKDTVSWSAPRAKGVEIRVYGVTKCFSDDVNGAIIDGWCLREHTVLPSSMRVLLAKAPASKGSVTWRMYQPLTTADGSEEGDRVYSIVLAAYGADGEPSTFAIAHSTHLCDILESMECPEGY